MTQRRLRKISEKMYHNINVNTAMISLWIPNRNLCWVFTTGKTITKANLSENLIIFHWRMSTIQPAWPVCTTSICWHTRCSYFCYCSSHKTKPSLKEFVVTQHWSRFGSFVTPSFIGIAQFFISITDRIQS